VLLLAVGGFLSAFFMLLHLRASGGGVPDDPDILAGKSRDFTHSVEEQLIQRLHVTAPSKKTNKAKSSVKKNMKTQLVYSRTAVRPVLPPHSFTFF
jgi:hypothetical protein